MSGELKERPQGEQADMASRSSRCSEHRSRNIHAQLPISPIDNGAGLVDDARRVDEQPAVWANSCGLQRRIGGPTDVVEPDVAVLIDDREPAVGYAGAVDVYSQPGELLAMRRERSVDRALEVEVLTRRRPDWRIR